MSWLRSVVNGTEVLKKYWLQRHELWSLYDSGVQMDAVGWFSVTHEAIAAQIAARQVALACSVIALCRVLPCHGMSPRVRGHSRCPGALVVDGFCGVGGNSIQFALAGATVIAIDNCPSRLAMARSAGSNTRPHPHKHRHTQTQAHA